ncbi:MAG: hypothetical protein E7345_02075 [Clostridiales bacterium]|nr:hypothetical protein [Clostridiales bacterium]
MLIKRVCCVIILGVLLVVNFYLNNVNYTYNFLVNNCDENVSCIGENEYEFLSLYLNDFLDKSNAEIVNDFYLEDRRILECYSSEISDYVIIDNNRVNIQISVYDNVCEVGIPLIKNSF